MTDLGLGTASNAYRDHHHSARQNTDKTIIVLTDGRSTEPDRTASQARNVHKYVGTNFADTYMLRVNVCRSEMRYIKIEIVLIWNGIAENFLLPSSKKPACNDVIETYTVGIYLLFTVYQVWL